MEDWGERDPAWRGVRSRRIEVRGHPVAYLHAEGAADGPPQLLVHGLGSSSRSWLDVIPQLRTAGEVVAVDLPGFGDTEIPPGGSARVRANAHFLRAFLDTLGWDRAVLFGSSMGGLVATLAAGWWPGRFAGLVLVNPALPALRHEMWRVPKQVRVRILPAALPGIGRHLVELGMRGLSAEELVEGSLDSILADPANVRPPLLEVITDSVRETLERPWRRRALAEAASSLVGMHLSGREVESAIAAITAPTLVFWGDADLLVSSHIIDGLLTRRAEWHRHDLEDVGHAPMVECPQEFSELVLGWYRHGLPADRVGAVRTGDPHRLDPEAQQRRSSTFA